MTHRYESLIAFNVLAKDEAQRAAIERIEKILLSEEATIEQIQRLDRRELAYQHDHLKSAYFVNFIYCAPPTAIEKIRAKLKLDEEVALFNTLRLPDKDSATTLAAQASS